MHSRRSLAGDCACVHVVMARTARMPDLLSRLQAVSRALGCRGSSHRQILPEYMSDEECGDSDSPVQGVVSMKSLERLAEAPSARSSRSSS
eukprot:34328-Amphidinium_carterae.1